MVAGPFSAPGITGSMVYGTSAQARVVDTKDPLEQGRIRIRLAGQDVISVDQLPWTKPKGSMHSGVGAHGETTHQFLIGQYVEVALDQYNQVMHVIGGINSPAQGGGEPGSADDNAPGWPNAARVMTTSLKQAAPMAQSFITEATGPLTMADGLFSGTGIKQAFDSVTHIQQTLKKNNGPAQHDEKPTAAPQTQQLFDAIKHIKQWDPSNLAGAIKPALDAMQNMLQQGGAGGGNPFQSLQGMFGSAFSAFSSAASGAGSAAANTVVIGNPCLLENLNTGETANGKIAMISGNLVCQPIKPTANTPNMTWVPQYIPPTSQLSS